MAKKSNDVDVEALKKKVLPIIRIAVLGPKGVGKTAIVNQFVNNSFEPQYEETDDDIRRYKKVHDLNCSPTDPQYVVFIIEDIFPTNHPDLVRESDFLKTNIYFGTLENRQQRFKEEQKNILDFDKQIYGYIFVFDGNQNDSYKGLEEPIKYISEYCEKQRSFSMLTTKKVVVANKSDLIEAQNQDKVFSKWKSLEKFNIPTRFVVSAKTGYNVNAVFEEIGKQILQDQKLDMIDKAWLTEMDSLINGIEQYRKKNKNSNQDDNNKKKGGNKGFLGCGEKRKQFVADDEDEDEDEEDEEFKNLQQYPGMMEDNKEGCNIF
ncbi:unnamed protein product [Paramecium primaurelia]|uniref:P-loop containing nucleoside triphosphate hydrolase n=1 Tax=Paramecium primaurelia TaxID=5886 RepID=A0A8S1KBE5_PARPR|nr:unnamed protein product [Paramecium primaurelia]